MRKCSQKENGWWNDTNNFDSQCFFFLYSETLGTFLRLCCLSLSHRLISSFEFSILCHSSLEIQVSKGARAQKAPKRLDTVCVFWKTQKRGPCDFEQSFPNKKATCTVLFNLRFHSCCRLSGVVYLRSLQRRKGSGWERERGLHVAIVDIPPHSRGSEKDASLPMNSPSVYVRWHITSVKETKKRPLLFAGHESKIFERSNLSIKLSKRIAQIVFLDERAKLVFATTLPSPNCRHKHTLR